VCCVPARRSSNLRLVRVALTKATLASETSPSNPWSGGLLAETCGPGCTFVLTLLPCVVLLFDVAPQYIIINLAMSDQFVRASPELQVCSYFAILLLACLRLTF
jgi:hypothetical protein